MSVQTETPALVRRSLAEASMPAIEFLRKIDGDPEELLPRTAAAMRTILIVRPPTDGAAPDQPPAEDPAFKVLAEAWSKRWARLSPVARLMAAATIPSRNFASGLTVLDDTMRAERDPRILALVLVTRVTDPTDDLLKTARGSEDQRVAELARLVGERLTEGFKVQALMTPRDLWGVRQQAEAPAR
jgi:hypothetical protein